MNSVIDSLLAEIERRQITDSNRTYPAGLFPTIRSNGLLGYQRHDSNIYFSALIALTLLDLLPHLTGPQQQRILKLTGRVTGLFPRFRSTRHPSLYNFYQRNPPAHYPNGFFLSKLKHFELADDADDTCMLSLVLQRVGQLNSNDVEQIREQLIEFSNQKRKCIQSSLPAYQNLKAYSVWFGSGKMPVEFDLCVLTNILCFVIRNRFEFNEQDLDSFAYIRLAIQNGDIEQRPFHISYTYPDPVVMYYHIARLYADLPDAERYLPGDLIIRRLQDLSANTASGLKRILLSTSLLRMGAEDPVVSWTMDTLKADMKTLGFFIAPMLKGTTHFLFNRFAHWPLFHIRFDCEAYYQALVLEYEVLRTVPANRTF